MLGEAQSLEQDHWYRVGERAGNRVKTATAAGGVKNTAEIEANLKQLQGKPRMQFIAGFKSVFFV